MFSFIGGQLRKVKYEYEREDGKIETWSCKVNSASDQTRWKQVLPWKRHKQKKESTTLNPNGDPYASRPLPVIPEQILTELQLREIGLPADCQSDPSRNNQFVPNVQSFDFQGDPGYENLSGPLNETESKECSRNNAIASLDQSFEGPYSVYCPEVSEETDETPSSESAESNIHSSEDEEYPEYQDPGYEYLPGLSEETNEQHDVSDHAQILAEQHLDYECHDIYNNKLEEGAECDEIVDFNRIDNMSVASITQTDVTFNSNQPQPNTITSPPKPAPRRPPRHFERERNISPQFSSNHMINRNNNNVEIEDGYEPLWNDSEQTIPPFDIGYTEDSEYDYTKSSRDTYLKLKSLQEAKGNSKLDCINDDEAYDYSTPYEPTSAPTMKEQMFPISHSNSPDGDDYDRIAVIEKLHADLRQQRGNYSQFYENTTDIDVGENISSPSKGIVDVLKTDEVFV